MPDFARRPLPRDAMDRPVGAAPVRAAPARQYLSGIQALVQLPLLQRERDRAAGLDTAGFVSGYRGSPLGGLDQALWREKAALAAAQVTFQPGVNEELAATAVWGTQQVGLFAGAKHDGVFGMWYGKGPGADRSMDVFKHANAAGTARHGGVLLVVGDDHGAKSSTLPHQSDHILAAAMVPVLNPSGVQDFLDLGLHGWAMSRFSGCWIGMKAIADTVETSAGVLVDPHRVTIRTPTDFAMPEGGLSIRWPDAPLEQELRLQRYKVYAAMAYARANGINRIVIDSPNPRLGIITTGKAHDDVLQALDALGIDERLAAQIGLRVFKVGMPWPLDPEGARHFAEGLEEVLVVEEKRQVIEYQLKEQLYNWREDVRPRVVGKYDEHGEWEAPARGWQLPAAGELSPSGIARVIAARIGRFHTSDAIAERLAFLDLKDRSLAQSHAAALRTPHYCSGCPHNSSTKVPEGSRALAGIGCHYMATWLSPETTQTFSQMGGEGVAWVGQAPFTETKHVFANLGDGTFAHSGLLAIRQAVAAAVPITYKILFNDAVAMTGGQPVEGTLTVPQVVAQVRAEGVGRVVVVTDQPERYVRMRDMPGDVPVRHRRELDATQRELRELPGTTVLVYDQTCAAEKRRRRKRGTYPDPARRVVINERVCEGCGDCSSTSNCMSVVPVETEWGRKRAIDQSSCNKDFSCLDGFCPSFVTVEGGKPRRGKAMAAPGGLGAAGGNASTGPLDTARAPAGPDVAPAPDADLPEPVLPPLDRPYGILVTGVGGTGIVTVGALLGTAATAEGKGVLALDMAGLAQKGGPVWSHVRIAATQDALHASRIASGEANLVLGCDLVVAASEESRSKMRAGLTHAVLNADVAVTSEVVRTQARQARTGDLAATPDPELPAELMLHQVAEAAGRSESVAATRLATALLGDSIAANLFMVGFAWQRGLIPLRAESILAAIGKNGAAVAMNRAAFAWGRRAAHDPAGVERAGTPATPEAPALSATLDEVIARRVAELTEYQDRRYAERYADAVARVRAREAAATPGRTALSEAVARHLFALMAAKDEYEVARLHTQTGLRERIAAGFEGEYRLVFHLAPPLLSRLDPVTGRPRKRAFGAWVLPLFGLLARVRRIRNTPLDPFRGTEDRRLERALLAEYEESLERLLPALSAQTHAVAVELAALPGQVRGFGPVRARHAVHARRRRETLLARLSDGAPPPATRPAHPLGEVVMAGE